MCFSATASFTAGAVLGTIGTASLSKAKKAEQIPFANIPIIFAIQQVCEGFVWLSFSRETFMPWHNQLVYGFLFFAQVLWPSFVPISILLLEQDTVRKKWLRFITLCGVAASVITTYRMINYPVLAEIKEHHLHYSFQAPHIFVLVTSVLYFISTILPGYVSGIKNMKLLASFMLGSLILSRIFYEVYFISVWCFFAALISSIVIYVVKNIENVQNPHHDHLSHLTGDYKKDHGLEH